MSSWPAANGMSDSSAVPIATEAPSGTKRATASPSDRSFIELMMVRRSDRYPVGTPGKGIMTQPRQAPAEPFGRLSAKEVNDRVSSGELKIVDVRENWEYARDHIPNAMLTPLGQIIARPQEAITSDNVVFVC